mmetsp:Transcript_9144/g.11439  ORF Transcript_9144/g.11439 Transcript_9144/m.11439 type:complete len:449 (-) Transcript_9144:136-1482(-)|eukprot:CAMPEP_0203643826 /NCGR_PEP_ID=MMETSP0088-20131115/9259_1 /ASSEMBLY_ACC=CAM_ASM_001087 /TAXON_ID=426623 /ORGANISM="Chaetoceros affinis, Strain CCMP159" /LENGTH=448 /DNA_ID=CAMNT_0050500135 /DNA_START=192 /DNA_END=1538 /DNA_ORIENTATION=+
MSIYQERKNDLQVLVKPVVIGGGGKKKRSLASLLSLHHDSTDDEDILVDTIPSKPTMNMNMNSNSNKRRKVVSIDSEWKLKEVPELPFLYLKERTSVVVMNDEPQRIASRIVQCAKKMNAYGQYCTTKAKATLTLDEMKFTIQLFKVSEKERTNKCVIVEIQRTNGSSIKFHKTARALLNAAKEKDMIRGSSSSAAAAQETSGSSSSSSDSNSHLVQSLSQPRLQTQSDEKENEKQMVVFTHTLEVVDALLKKDRVDANLLGMESLQLLTEHRSSSDAMVQFASNVVIAGEQQFEDIQDTIVSLIENGCSSSNQDEESSPNKDNNNNSAEEDYCRKIHTSALSILSNSLKNFVGNNSVVQSLADRLFISLLGELKRADVTPQNACLACKCLEEFFLKSAVLRNRGLELDVYNVISNCHNIGITSYPLLKSASDKVLQTLGEAKETNTK